MLDIRLFKDEFPLIEECPSSSVNYGNAYTSIFGDGNSFESIFELYFERNQSVQNTLISNFFGSSSSRVGYVSADERLYQDAYSGNNDIFRYTDCRYLEGIYDNTNNFGIQKYTCDRIIIPEIVQNKKPSVSASVRNTNYANWIIYRLTDVMLMKAEAQALLVQKGMNDLNDSIKNENSVGAFKLVSCVFNRANNLNDMSKDTLVYDDYTNAMEDLVLTERRRELLFEGKRWFDLVRQAKRNQSTSSLVNTVIPKFKTNANVIRIKLASMDAIYFPYSESELTANPLLVQNPAYQTSETIEK